MQIERCQYSRCRIVMKWGDESWRSQGKRRRRRRGERSGWRGLCPLFKFFFRFLSSERFGAFWELILLQLNCLSYTHKPRLWLVKPAIASLYVKNVRDFCMTVPLGLKSGGHVPLFPLWIRHSIGNYMRLPSSKYKKALFAVRVEE